MMATVTTPVGQTPQDVAVTLGEAARELGISHQNISNWIKKGWLPVLQESPGAGQPATVDLNAVRAVAELRAPRRHKRTARPHRPPHGAPPPPPSRRAPTAKDTVTITITISPSAGVTVITG